MVAEAESSISVCKGSFQVWGSATAWIFFPSQACDASQREIPNVFLAYRRQLLTFHLSLRSSLASIEQ